jgi:hypothetical protein
MRHIPSVGTLVLSLAVMAALATPAFAWNTPYHQYHLQAKNNTGSFVNDDSIYVMSRSDNGPWVAPTLSAPPFTPEPGWGWAPPATVIGNSLGIKFVGPLTPSGAPVWKNVYIKVPGDGNPWQSCIFEQWTLNGVPVGKRVALGFCTSSPAKIANPNVTPEGTANTANMVVRNLQFAQSPQYIPNDQLTLDSPTAIALFAASADPVRPGPITATPGTCQDISPDIDSSIGAPLSSGRTVLAKGTVEDADGNQYAFVAQFVAPPTALPGLTAPGQIVLTILLIAAVAIWLERRRRSGKAPKAAV